MGRTNWVVDHFPVKNAGFVVRVTREREFYWKKKSLFHIFLAGRADPIFGYPDHLQAPLPEGMAMWRGL